MKRLKKRAFSLIEVLLTLALIGLIGGVFAVKGASFYQQFQKNQEKNALLQIIRKAHIYASMSGQPLELRFSYSESCCLAVIETLKIQKKLKILRPNKSLSKINFKDSVQILPKPLTFSVLGEERLIYMVFKNGDFLFQ